MKQAQAENGGRPFNNEDFLIIQQELTDAVQAQFLGKGPFILTGCMVSGPAAAANVTAGIVCLDGQLLRYGGQSGVALPAQFQAGAVVFSDQRPYQTGGSKYCMREIPAVLVASDPTYSLGEFLPIDTWGGKTWGHIIATQGRAVGDIQWSANQSLNDYDNGVGKPGTAAWGWSLCDGQSGRANLLGQFIVGQDPNRPDYDTIGKTGGAAEVALATAQLPSHTHEANFDITDDHNSGPGAGDFRAAPNAAPRPNANGKTIITKPTGSGQAHENRPQFYVLAVRQWVGY